MSHDAARSDDTCWTVIRAAAAGDAAARDVFGRSYLPPVRAYFGARWRSPTLRGEIDDAVQEVFVELLRPDGALSAADPARAGGFRAYLFGVARNVARRFEERRTRRDASDPVDPDGIACDETSLSLAFDRGWARAVVRDAAALQQQRAAKDGAEALRRVEILRLRFEEGLPIRDVAERLAESAEKVHHEYARARREFEEALVEVVRDRQGGTPGEVRAECRRLVALLS